MNFISINLFLLFLKENIQLIPILSDPLYSAYISLETNIILIANIYPGG